MRGAEGEDGVQSAEGEGIREGVFNANCARLIWNVVEIAFGIGFGEICGGRQDAVLQSHDRRDGLDGAGGAERVAVHRFRRADREALGVRAEHFMDRASLGGIVSRRARAVRVDIAELFGREIPRLSAPSASRAPGPRPWAA